MDEVNQQPEEKVEGGNQVNLAGKRDIASDNDEVDVSIRQEIGPLEENELANPTRGLSKKEKRRIEVLKHDLEPRVEKLERQIEEQLEKINTLGDKREDGKLITEIEKEQESQAEEVQTKETQTFEGKGTGSNEEGPISKLIKALQKAGLDQDPTALRLLAELADLNLRENKTPVVKSSHVIQPSGGGWPTALDLRGEYEKRATALRPGDIDGLLEVKREFRKRGLEIY